MIAKFWAAAREWAARLFRRKPVEPGRFVADSKLAWRGWLAVNPWLWPSREYLVYVPRAYGGWRRRPLLVLLHGCRQTPEDFAAATRIAALADSNGWLVLLPRQSGKANAWTCWNWFDKPTSAGRGEAAIIAAQIRAVRRAYRVHPRRIFVGRHVRRRLPRRRAGPAPPETLGRRGCAFRRRLRRGVGTDDRHASAEARRRYADRSDCRRRARGRAAARAAGTLADHPRQR